LEKENLNNNFFKLIFCILLYTNAVYGNICLPPDSISKKQVSFFGCSDYRKRNQGSDNLPFGFADFSWMNGQNRQQEFPLSTKYVNLGLYIDNYYAYSFNNPLDHTITGSASVGRHNEFIVNSVSISLESNYKKAIGRFAIQAGSMINPVQDLDPTASRGRYVSIDDLKLIREAVAGYHWDWRYGINFEMGIFTSYIGLESYLNQENWNYQRSLPSDFTPFYFSGIRLQFFPTQKLKIEPWLINGWQSYQKFNRGFGTGLSIYYRPSGSIATAYNFYYGNDQRNNPGRNRFHHDHSLLVKLYDNKAAASVSRLALSINNHYGFEQGGIGPSAKNAFMVGSSVVTRLQFYKNKMGLTFRFSYLNNPSRYLITPPTVQDFLTDSTQTTNSIELSDFTTTLDLMPNDFVTFRLEFCNRNASIPFFAGKKSTTSPDGWQNTPDPTNSRQPDLVRSENRLLFGIHFRL
jgi:hypothetical protein